MKRLLLLLLFVAGMGLLPRTVVAEFRLLPLFDLEQRYNDNLFLSDTDREDDWITSAAPGVDLRYRTGWLDSSLRYQLVFLYYQENSDLNETSLKDTQRIAAAFTLLPERPFSLEVRDEYDRVAISSRRDATVIDDIENRANRNRLTVNPRLRLNLAPTVESIFSYLYEDINYRSATGAAATIADDTVSHIARVELTKQMNARLSLLGEGSWEWHDSALNEDYQRQELLAGFIWQAMRNWTASVKAGPGRTEFDTGPAETGLVLDSSLRFDSLPWQASLSYVRDLLNAADEGTYRSERVRAEVAHVARLTTRLGLFWYESDYLRVERNDDEVGGDLSVSYRLTPRLSALVGGAYSRLNFDPEGEEVDRYSGYAGLEYSLRRVLLSLTWTHRRNDSSVALNDYFNNVIFLRATLHH